jgi:hypothetical protein
MDYYNHLQVMRSNRFLFSAGDEFEKERPRRVKPLLYVYADIPLHESEVQRLRGELQIAHEASRLPELPSEETQNAFNDLLVRVRLATRQGT